MPGRLLVRHMEWVRLSRESRWLPRRQVEAGLQDVDGSLLGEVTFSLSGYRGTAGLSVISPRVFANSTAYATSRSSPTLLRKLAVRMVASCGTCAKGWSTASGVGCCDSCWHWRSRKAFIFARMTESLEGGLLCCCSSGTLLCQNLIVKRYYYNLLFLCLLRQEKGQAVEMLMQVTEQWQADVNGVGEKETKPCVACVKESPTPLPGRGVESLIHTLKQSSSPTTRWWAASDLGRLGTLGSTAVPDLIEAIRQDRCLHVRAAAAEALGLVGDGCESATTRYRECFGTPKFLFVKLSTLVTLPAARKHPPRRSSFLMEIQCQLFGVRNNCLLTIVYLALHVGRSLRIGVCRLFSN